MKNLLPGSRTLALAAIVMLTFVATMARADGNGNGPMQIRIVEPITITKIADLEFGRLSSGAAGGTSVVSAAGSRSVTGDVIAEGGTVSAAEFEVGGHQLLDYDITLPSSVVITSGGNTMTVDAFTTDKPGNVGDVPPGGDDSFFVGATLNVGASQAAGTYTGTFDVSVAYQ